VGVEDEYPYIKISDTGHGIPEEDLDRLFDPFFSTKGEFAKFESQKQFTGNGLGLAICNLIMKKNGGSISAESNVGEGTTFTIKFDDAPPESLNIERHLSADEIEEEVEIKNGQNKRILILDDEVELCKLLNHMFSTHGYVVECLDDGHIGLEKHKTDPFDLVITDVQMPKMTGLEFLNKLSNIEGPQPKKIVMTGRITKQETGDTQLDEFVQKPFDLIRFMSKIQQLLGL
jgi:two-component system cell cycle sensor histidine kinase/response regulator CckA